jgi:peptide/nickel transport system permease protein
MVIINFFLPRMMPGDPFDFLAVEEGSTTVTLTQEQILQYRAYYGMDKGIMEQFKDYLFNLVRGDFGKSIYYNRPVTEMVFERILWTLVLVIVSLVISSMIGMILGMISAYARYHTKYLDAILIRIMTIMAEIPDFILALFLLFFFAAKLGWFPLSGGITPFATYETTGEF